MNAHAAIPASLAVDLPALLAVVLATIACGSLGNFLVLRRESMTGDAIAHAVLPGLVGGYLVTGTRSPLAMFAGATVAGVAAVLLAGAARRLARIEPGAALGVVFTAAFALGVALLETSGARQVDLDPDCVLFGSLETLFFVLPRDAHWTAGVPTPLWTLAAAAAGALLFSLLLERPLVALAFDRTHALHTGAAPRWLDRALLAATSAAVVASFEAVGTVLAIALVACPALAAAPFARSARGQLAGALAIGTVLATIGYLLAAHADRLLGTRHALHAAGVVAALLALAVPASHGLRRALRGRVVSPPPG